MKKPLKIIIFDGSFKTTPFISRLIIGLAEKHDIYVMGFNEDLKKKLPNVTYVPLGNNQNKLRFISTSFKSALKSKNLKTVFKSVGLLFRGNRTALQQQNLNFALKKIQPDIVHLQWPSLFPWVEEMLQEKTYTFVLSQRGFHINVRPFVEPDNLVYLQYWYPKIAGFHSVCEAISRRGDRIYNSNKKIDRVVYTGFPIKDLPFEKTYQKKKSLNLISVGRAHWIKGYEYALRTCALLKDKGIEFTYTIIGGAGDEELQFLLHSLQLEDNVNLTDRLPQKSVFENMRKSSLLILPSIQEGLPNVVVEAMAIGLPAISTRCGGVDELIENNKTGWLVPVRDPEAMAEAVVNFNKLPLEAIDTIRKAARAKVEVQHNEAQVVAGMESLYYEVIEMSS